MAVDSFVMPRKKVAFLLEIGYTVYKPLDVWLNVKEWMVYEKTRE